MAKKKMRGAEEQDLFLMPNKEFDNNNPSVYDEMQLDIKKTVVIDFPVYLRNKAGTMYICQDDVYRFMRIDIAKKTTHSHWSIQFGLNYAYEYERYEEDRENLERHFIQRLIHLNVKITQTEFFDKLAEYDQWFQQYQNFFNTNQSKPVVVEAITQNKEEEIAVPIEQDEMFFNSQDEDTPF